MKNFTFIFMLFLFCTSCKKETTKPSGEVALSHGIAKFNGHNWEAIGLINEYKGIKSFSLDSSFIFENEWYNRNTLTILNAPIEVGCYKLCQSDSSGRIVKKGRITALFGTSIDGGDVNGATYILDETKKNNIEIIYVNEDKTEIEARFQAHFNRIQKTAIGQPLTISLTEGKMYLKKF